MYHGIFSLGPGELGCIDQVKHEVKVIDNEPFKERFWRIPQPMVDEVHVHVKDILEGCNSPKPEPVVQCCCAGMQEGWRFTLLH